MSKNTDKTSEGFMREEGQKKFTDQNFFKTKTLKSGKEKKVHLKITESAIGRSKITEEAFEIAPHILNEFDKRDKNGRQTTRKDWIKILMKHPNFREDEFENIPDKYKMSKEEGMAGIIISVLSICLANISMLKDTNFSIREALGRQIGKLLFYEEKNPDKQSIHGMAFAESVLGVCSFVTKSLTSKAGGKKKQVVYNLTSELTEDMEDYLITMLDSRFYGLPLSVPPKDWEFVTEDGEKYKLVGGYHDIQIPLIKVRFNRGMGMIKRQSSEELLKAVNYLQSIPYRVNKSMYKEALAELASLSPKKEDFVIKIVGEDDRFDEKEYESARGKYIRKKIILQYIKDYVDLDRFYQVYQIDYRGRVYTASSVISTISDDFGKSLIEFADSYTVSDEGVEWAYASLASLAGDDKLLFEDRVVLGKKYFHDTPPEEPEEPWQYKALHYAIKDMLNRKPVNISVPFDASTSGWQFLSLICNSREGMTKTNLLDNSTRYDLYLEVAAATVAFITKKLNLIAASLLSEQGLQDYLPTEERKTSIDKLRKRFKEHNIMLDLMRDHGRALAKTPTMTRVYSATKGNSKHVVRAKVLSKIKSFESIQSKQEIETASYNLGGIIHDMVNTVVPGASEYQEKVRKVITKNYKDTGKASKWTTPDGLTCMNIKCKEVQTETKVPAIGKKRLKLMRLSIVNDSNGRPLLSSGRMANGASPNTIHTVDAYFLRQVVIKAYEEGITRLITIHDSFSCDLNSCTRYNEILREVLVEVMTSGKIQKMFKNMGFEVPVIDKMDKEEFDMILKNPYCFA